MNDPPPADVPHIPDNREEFFLQTDAELIKQREKLSKVNYDKGNAIKLPGKALSVKVRERTRSTRRNVLPLTL